MNGYSSHTYSWLNADNELFWVKYHFKTDQGIEFLTQEEGDEMAGDRRRLRISATCTRRSSAAITRAGRYTCRSCRSKRPRPTGSTRST